MKISRHEFCMSFGMTNMMTVPGSNAKTGALFEGLCVPADSAAVLKRSTAPGAPRVQSAIRNQVELRVCDLDASLPADHQARAVWAFVQSLDLQGLYARIKAVEGSVGRAPIDPAILMSLWLYATLDGVGSARELDRLCASEDAYRWLCGGVGVNHHTLGDFRVKHEQWLDGQLTANVAALLSQGLVSMNRVAHDGMRVRAHAGAASFRRSETLVLLCHKICYYFNSINSDRRLYERGQGVQPVHRTFV